MQTLNTSLVNPKSPLGIVSLQFAHTPELSQEIIGSWDQSARDSAQSGLLLDFLFPICYSTALTIACFWAVSLFRERGYRKTGWLAAGIAWAQWPAAVFDYMENVALWVEIRGTIADPWPRIAFIVRIDQVLPGRDGACHPDRGTSRLDLSVSGGSRSDTGRRPASIMMMVHPER